MTGRWALPLSDFVGDGSGVSFELEAAFEDDEYLIVCFLLYVRVGRAVVDMLGWGRWWWREVEIKRRDHTRIRVLFTSFHSDHPITSTARSKA